MLAPGRRYIGAPVAIEAEYRNASGVLIDPTTVSLKTRSPSGTVSTYTYGVTSAPIKLATGRYRIEVTPDQPGRWHWRWQTTGSGLVSAEEGSFTVKASPFYDDFEDAYNV